MRHWFGGKAGDDVEGEIDSIELDMGQRVQESDAAGQGVQRPLPDGLWRYELGFCRAARPIGERRI